MSDTKPRYRVPAFTSDSYVNFAANLGYGTRNLQSSSSYQLSPVSRNRWQMEMMYRGSWLVRQIVDAVSEDMTRAGIVLNTDMPPDDEATLMESWNERELWQGLQSTIKWARLYGGALGVIMLDGQDLSQPLRLNTVGENQFKGLLALDRWMVNPSLENLIREPGPEMGQPMYYTVVSDAHSIPNARIHHSRCIRFLGAELPYWQSMSENGWGLSVIEPMFDRLVAFDSCTAGAAQLIYKAHLRTLYVENLRNLIAGGGKSYQAFIESINLMRLNQSNEGMTILDSNDKFESQSYGFGGLAEMLVQFGQQLSGAAQIPLVRLFGQSPAGMNATGESDLRNYYDMIASQQEAKLRRPIHRLLEVACRSEFGRGLPQGFAFGFRPLWQMQETEKAQVAGTNTQTIINAYEQGLISPKIALSELREQSVGTGIWTNITDEDIEKADEQPPSPFEGAKEPNINPPGETHPSVIQKAPDGAPIALPRPNKRRQVQEILRQAPRHHALRAIGAIDGAPPVGSGESEPSRFAGINGKVPE